MVYYRRGSRISSWRGAHLKKLRREEGGAKIFGIFRVKKSRFYTTKSYFSNCGGRRENFRVKNHDFTQKNRIFFNFRIDWCLRPNLAIFQLYHILRRK